jgi:CO dehydrogenase/acetyl-CoA synthase beta subunit
MLKKKVQKNRKTGMNMQLYDKEILKFKKLIAEYPIERENISKAWQMSEQEELILRGDMAYELGGGTMAAISGLGFVASEEIVPEDSIICVGQDLADIHQDVAYARMTFIRLNQTVVEGKVDEQLYSAIRRIDYTRYHMFPRGFMMRISSVKEREVVRVSKKAIEQGATFSAIGKGFIEQYKKYPGVEAVQIYFITLPQADYPQIQNIARRLEQITESLNHIFHGIVMDCTTCNLKQVCDEVEGLRELHKKVPKDISLLKPFLK